MIELKNVEKRYQNFELKVDFSVEKGEFFTILGPSGCGKTTILRIVGGFEKQDAGRIFIDKKDVTNLPPYKRDFGIVFQDYALFPHMNVFDNISFGLKVKKFSKIEERVSFLLELVNLSGYEKRMPHELSGGEKQRVALARSLAPNPKILLLDEPLSALDARLRESLREEVREISKKMKVTTIYVTHDQKEALAISDRVLVLRDGKVEQIGAPKEIYKAPKTLFVAEFLGGGNFFSGKIIKKTQKYCLLENGFKIPKTEKNLGEKVNFMVRPENCVLKENPNHKNCFKVEVENVEFLGSHTKIKVRSKFGKHLVLSKKFEKKKKLYLCFDTKDVIIF